MECTRINLKLSFFALAASILLCLSMGAKPRPAPKAPAERPVTVSSVKVMVANLKGFDSTQTMRFLDIVAKTEVVINSKQFKTELTLAGVDLVDTRDSTQRVYERIISKDWSLEYRLEWVCLFCSTIGYTYPTVSWIAFNSKKWDDLTDADISANICHEYGGHKFGGYTHSMAWTPQRDRSAPYWIGSTCAKVYKLLFP